MNADGFRPHAARRLGGARTLAVRSADQGEQGLLATFRARFGSHGKKARRWIESGERYRGAEHVGRPEPSGRGLVMVPGQPRRRGRREQVGVNRGVSVAVAMAHHPGRRRGRFAARGSFAARRRFLRILRAGAAATATLRRAATADMLRRRRGRVPFLGVNREPHTADGEQVRGECEAGNKLSAGRSPGQDSSNTPHEGMCRSGERLLCGALYGHLAEPARLPLLPWLRSPELYPFTDQW